MSRHLWELSKSIVRKTSLVFLLVIVSNSNYGQISTNFRKSIFVEIAGSGGLGSINYEKHFFNKNRLTLTWRAGLSCAPIDKNNGTGIVFPLMVNALLGKNAHQLELGLGQGFTITTKGSFFTLTTAAIGYRFQPKSKNWFYRITYTPLISYLIDFQIQQWAGLSIGYTLNKKGK